MYSIMVPAAPRPTIIGAMLATRVFPRCAPFCGSTHFSQNEGVHPPRGLLHPRGHAVHRGHISVVLHEAVLGTVWTNPAAGRSRHHLTHSSFRRFRGILAISWHGGPAPHGLPVLRNVSCCWLWYDSVRVGTLSAVRCAGVYSRRRAPALD